MDDEPVAPAPDADTSVELAHAQRLSEAFGEHKYDKVVAFVDMLGFSSMTEEYRVEPEVLEELQRPGAIEFLTASLEGANPLSEAIGHNLTPQFN